MLPEYRMPPEGRLAGWPPPKHPLPVSLRSKGAPVAGAGSLDRDPAPATGTRSRSTSVGNGWVWRRQRVGAALAGCVRAGLHALGEGNAEQSQARREDAKGRGAQGQPGFPGGLVPGLEHRALLVERGEQAGRLEDVSAEPVRFAASATCSTAAPKPSNCSARARSASSSPGWPTGPSRFRQLPGQARPAGRWTGSWPWRTAGRGRCCRAARASSPSRRRTRCPAPWTGRRT